MRLPGPWSGALNISVMDIPARPWDHRPVMVGDEKRLGEYLERALRGDQVAYRSFLEELAVVLRDEYRDEALVRAILLEVHAKRDLYRPGMPVTHWVRVIARSRDVAIVANGRSHGRRLAFFRRYLDGEI